MAQACYVKHDNERLLVSDQVPCSTATPSNAPSQAVLCCSGTDICGPDGFCHFTHAQDDPVTGYYLGGCTDSKFEAAACPQHCTSYGTQDVIYTPDNGLWSCCWGSGELDCRYPSNETFAAPGPEALFAVGTASASGAAAEATASSHAAASAVSSNEPNAAASTAGTATAGASSAATKPSSSDHDTTTTIAAAVTVPVIVLLAALLGFWLWRRKKQRRRKAGESDGFAQPTAHVGEAQDAGDHPPQYRSEQPGMTAYPKFEMSADRERSELDSRTRGHEGVRGFASELQ